MTASGLSSLQLISNVTYYTTFQLQSRSKPKHHNAKFLDLLTYYFTISIPRVPVSKRTCKRPNPPFPSPCATCKRLPPHFLKKILPSLLYQLLNSQENLINSINTSASHQRGPEVRISGFHLFMETPDDPG